MEIQNEAPLTESELLEGVSTLCQRSFFDFIEEIKPDYVFNWHHLVLIDALQRLAESDPWPIGS